MMQLVPYSYSGGSAFNDVEYSLRSVSAPVVTRPGLAVGIHMVIHPQAAEVAADKFERWFAGRGEVSVVDVGIAEKSKSGFIVLEWLECDIDPLFLSILDEEEAVADYSLYGRQLEG